MAAMPLDHGARAGMQIAGARVITEPLPEMQHLVERGRGQCANIGKTRHESVKIASDRDDGGLLQHDLAKPDAVGIGGLARQRPPGQVAAVPVVPDEQRGRIGPARSGFTERERFGCGFGSGRHEPRQDEYE